VSEPGTHTRAAGYGTVPALLTARAAADPDRVALQVADGDRLTYREWDRRSDAVAWGMRDRGLRNGDPVGLVFEAGGWIDYAVAYCGVQKAGGVAVPLGAHLGPATIADLLGRCGVAGTVHGRSGPVPATPGWRTGIGALERDGGPIDVTVRPGDPAQILYTSGTTGHPKGVAATHANLTYGLDPAARRRPLAHSRHCLHAFALGSNAAQTMLVSALVTAPTTVIAPSFEAESFGALIERYAVGSVFVVPAMAIELVNRRIPQRHDLSSVLLLGSTAAALPPAVALALTGALPGATLTNSYTSTEAAPARLTMVFDPERPGALGRPEWPGDVRITDEDGWQVEAGRTGAVWLRSAAPPRGYHDDLAAGTRVFADGWVAMGDLGYQDADGYLHLVDRADDIVKSGALAVSTLRVEAALHEHPGVAETAVAGVPHPVLGQVLAAAVVPAGDVTEADLRAFLADRLGRHELPALIRFTESLPYNAAGKVVKGELRAMLALGAHRAGPAPETPTETTLARLWTRLLGVDRAGTADDFFALGGDSMRAAQLATLAGEAFGLSIPSALVHDRPDLAGQAVWIDEARPVAPAEAPPGDGADQSPVGSLPEHLLNWMHELEPPRDVGPMQVAVRIHEDVDPAVLADALDALVHRHDALRTRFDRGPRGWTATVLDDLPPELVTRTATGATAAGRRHEAAKLVSAEVTRPFDWRHGPLVRAVLVRVDAGDHIAALVVHHLVVDGWSMGILLRELGLLYSALRSGHAPWLPPATQSAEVVDWNRRQWARTRPLWRAALEGAPPAVERFPGRRPARTYRAASHLFHLDQADDLRSAAERHRTSPFVLVAACWLAVLARHTGATEFVALTPVTGRARPEFETAVGCLAQSLLVRVEVGDDPQPALLVERLRDGLLTATDRQAYPFAEFGAEVPYPVEIPFSRWPGAPHFPGLISEAFELPHGLVWTWTLPGEDRGVPKLELAELAGGRIEGRLTYNRHAFAAGTVGRLADELMTAVAGATAQDDPRRSEPIGASPLTPAGSSR
jgi:acyl-CoA synthetase (AMP-forming)/AMP-acid ligase II